MSDETLKEYKGLESSLKNVEKLIQEESEPVVEDFFEDEYKDTGNSFDPEGFTEGGSEPSLFSDNNEDDVIFEFDGDELEEFQDGLEGEEVSYDLEDGEDGSKGELGVVEDDGELKRKEEMLERANQAKEKMQDAKVTVDLNYVFEDGEGNFIEPRNYDGGYMVDVISIEQIKGVGTEVRKGDLEIANLQEDIHRYGILEPLHVVPTRQIGVKDGKPVYSRYLLLGGRRRLECCVNLGYREVPCIVDSTIPPKLIKIYEAVINNNKEYTFTEKLAHARFLEDSQSNITNEMIENILGWKSGEYLKAQYIDQMKKDYPDIYRYVEIKKMTIEQGFKKIEKEIEKAEKELAEPMDQQEIEDELRDKNRDELTELQIETQRQKVGDRKILDPMVRKSVEIRDRHCQCCGYGKGEEDFMGVFNVHHIIAVMYGGSDDKYNLILLCANCHKLVHDYEVGRFIPSQATYDKRSDVKRIVVLGNMLKRMRMLALEGLKTKYVEVWRQVNKGVLPLGKAIEKSGINLNGEKIFEPSPYERFMIATEDVDLGVGVKGELGNINWLLDDGEES